MSKSKPTVIIIGAGYGGVHLAVDLDKSQEFRVLLIERNAYFTHNIAALRAVTQDTWIDNVILDHSNIFTGSSTGSKVIQGSVKEIRVEKQEIYLSENDDVPLSYDYLVIATGASYRFPGKLVDVSMSNAKAVYKKVYADVKKARHVVIVGGGSVGVELAGEIGAEYNSSNRSKQITLVHSGSHLLSAYPFLKESACENLRDILQYQLHVNVLLNDVVNVPDSLLSSEELYIDQPTRLTTKSGKQLDADVVIYTIGGLPNTEFLRESQSFPVSAFDGRGHIQVNDYLQVTAGDMKYSNVYAIGDAASFQPGLAFYAGGQATWLGKHLLDILHGTPIESTKPMKLGPLAMVIPLGPKLGGGLLPLPIFGGVYVGSTITSLLKGKTLGKDKLKGLLNLK